MNSASDEAPEASTSTDIVDLQAGAMEKGVRESGTQVVPSPFSGLVPPPGGVSIQLIADYVRQYPADSAGEILAKMNQNHGPFFRRTNQQLLGYIATAIAAERALCQDLIRQWNEAGNNPDEQRTTFYALRVQINEGANRFLRDEDYFATTPYPDLDNGGSDDTASL
jgi:hypothetical protein